MDSIVHRPMTPCGVPGLCAGEALCVHDNFFCVWLFTIYTVLCCAHLCWSDIKVLCPLAVYVISGSIVASVGVNPSQTVPGSKPWACRLRWFVHMLVAMNSVQPTTTHVSLCL